MEDEEKEKGPDKIQFAVVIDEGTFSIVNKLPLQQTPVKFPMIFGEHAEITLLSITLLPIFAVSTPVTKEVPNAVCLTVVL